MGASQSIDLQSIDNDFELVIRVSKAMEQTLINDFGYKDSSLMANIGKLKARHHSISNRTPDAMRELAHIRNCLVHQPGKSSLEDFNVRRNDFIRNYEAVQKDLQRALRSRNRAAVTPGTKEANSGLGFGGAALLVGGIAALALAASSSREDEEEEKQRRQRQLRYY